MDVEINIVNQNRSSNQRWYFDNSDRKAAIDIKQDNQISKLIFHYETDEVYQIRAQTNQPDNLIQPPDGAPLYPSFCIAYKLSTFEANEFVDFGLLKRNSTFFMPYPDSSEIFKFRAQV